MYRPVRVAVCIQQSFSNVISVRNFSRRLGDTDSVRQSFGSFHSEDIETLVNTPHLRPPDVMQELLASTQTKWEVCKSLSFGSECRDPLFSLDSSWTFLNHGAFGGAMKPQMEAAQFWRRHCEAQPLRFYDRELFPLMAYSLQQAARHFSCPANELYPLQNVTTGLNCILQSINLSPGDEVVHLSLTYGSTKKMLQDVCQRSGASLKIVQLPLPIENEQSVVDKFFNTLSARTRLVIIDQITSNTALVLPTLEMARLAKQAGALVVVDAAHAMMSTPVRIYPSDATLRYNVSHAIEEESPAQVGTKRVPHNSDHTGTVLRTQGLRVHVGATRSGGAPTATCGVARISGARNDVGQIRQSSAVVA
jgi:hypothetical protein